MDTFSEYYLKKIFFLNLRIFWLHCVFVAACRLSSLVEKSRSYFLFAVCGLLIVVVFLLQSTDCRHAGFSTCARGLSTCGLWTLELAGSVVGKHRLSSSQESSWARDPNPCPLYWQAVLIHSTRSPEYCFQMHKIRTPKRHCEYNVL